MLQEHGHIGLEHSSKLPSWRSGFAHDPGQKCVNNSIKID